MMLAIYVTMGNFKIKSLLVPTAFTFNFFRMKENHFAIMNSQVKLHMDRLRWLLRMPQLWNLPLSDIYS